MNLKFKLYSLVIYCYFITMATHQASVCVKPGHPLILQSRPTPSPASNEILIKIHAIALNPIDYSQRDKNLPPVQPSSSQESCAVLGCDVSGTVVANGPEVSHPLDVGTRVLSFATSYYHDGSPDYGAFQEYALVSSELVAPMPDDMTFDQGAIVPVALVTALTGFTTIGIPISTKYTPDDKEAILIWGGSSSVGSFAVQTSKALGFTVYATAGEQNLDLVKGLGADAVFDHKALDVVEQIINKAKTDGVNLSTAQVAVEGTLQQTLDVLAETKGSRRAMVAHAPLLPDDHPTLEDCEIRFNYPPLDKEERNKHFYECFRVWLPKAFDRKEIVPSPRIQCVEGGLTAINGGLDVLRFGVSGTKIVIPLQ